MTMTEETIETITIRPRGSGRWDINGGAFCIQKVDGIYGVYVPTSARPLMTGQTLEEAIDRVIGGRKLMAPA